jgi:serine protease Do
MIEAAATGRPLAVAVLLGLLYAGPVAAQEAAFAGLQIQGMSPEAAAALGMDKEKGVLVRDVALGGPSDKAGFRRGDLILKFAGKDVKSFEELVGIVGGLKAGQKVQAEVKRADKTATLTLELDVKPAQLRIAKDAFAALPAVGLTIAAVTDKVRETLNVRWGSTGVLVTIVDAEKAQGTDLRQGELIVQVNQQEVWLPEQVLQRYSEAKAKGKEKLLLLVEGPEGFRFSLLPVR